MIVHRVAEIEVLCLGHRSYVDELAAVATFGELNCAVDKGIEGMVFTDTYVQTGVVNCTALAFQDIAGFGILTAENLNTESFALRQATRVCTSAAIFFLQIVIISFFLVYQINTLLR